MDAPTMESVPSGVVQLQIMSDLHLETPRYMPMYNAFNITPRCPHLALLGDIGNVHDTKLFSFLESQLWQFDIVFFVLGNHEPYKLDSQRLQGHKMAVDILEQFEAANTTARLKQEGAASLGRFVFLNRRRFDLSDRVTILGATLFSHITDDQRSTTSLFVSDFSNIDGWTVDDHNAAHAVDLAWLNREVEAISRESGILHEDDPPTSDASPRERNIVILSHYSPTISPRANDADHLEDDRGVQTAFATDLSAEPCWTKACVKVWAFGHTHFNCDLEEDDGKRIVANQRGYGREDAFDFDADKVITIG